MDVCPASEKCPIFSGLLKDKTYTCKGYRLKYCEAGEAGRSACRRWQCKMAYGRVPDDLLPNALATLEDVAKENGWPPPPAIFGAESG